MLSNFQQALEQHKDELGYNQFWRYAKAGKLPRILLWIVKHPNLIEALAADARALAAQHNDTTAPTMGRRD